MTEKLERTYTVPLRRGYNNTPRHKRTNKAVKVLQEFLAKHMKSQNIKIGPKLNSLLWRKGIKNPPSKVTVTAKRDENNIVRVELKGVDYVDFKLQEKTQRNQSLKEKLQSKVSDAKDSKDDKEPTETTKKSTTNTSSKETNATKKTETKAQEKETATPKKETTTKTQPTASN